MADYNGAAPEAALPKKPKGGRKKILLVLALVLVLAAGAAAAKFLLFSSPKSPDAAPAKKAKLETMELDSIVVNLADRDTAHYLRVTIVLAYTGDHKHAKELEEHKFAMRDGVIRLLRQKTNAEVSAPDGAEKLKRELIREINSHLGGKEISDIYLSEYLVQ
jgi:flagellar FliL protein